MITPIEFCEKFKPCPEGLVYVEKHETLAEAWEQCHRPDWMLWVMDRIGYPRDDKNLRLFAVWCARKTPMHDGRTTDALLTDPRSVAAIEVAERFANGNATEAELAAAEAAAWAAAWAAAEDAAAAAARAAAGAAAGDAAWAAAWAAAEDAAGDAAEAAAEAAAAAAARAAAAAAARAAAADGAWAAQADALRKLVNNPFMKEGAK
jgi:hypothetical protein